MHRRCWLLAVMPLMIVSLLALAACGGGGELDVCSAAASPGLGEVPPIGEGGVASMIPASSVCLPPNTKVVAGSVRISDRDKLVGDVVMIVRFPRAATELDWSFTGFSQAGQALSESEVEDVLESAGISPVEKGIMSTIYPELAGKMTCIAPTLAGSKEARCSAQIEYSASGPVDDLKTTEVYFIAFGKECKEVVHLTGVDRCVIY